MDEIKLLLQDLSLPNPQTCSSTPLPEHRKNPPPPPLSDPLELPEVEEDDPTVATLVETDSKRRRKRKNRKKKRVVKEMMLWIVLDVLVGTGWMPWQKPSLSLMACMLLMHKPMRSSISMIDCSTGILEPQPQTQEQDSGTIISMAYPWKST